MKWLSLLLLAGCTAPAKKCPGAAPSMTLFESYCPNGEAARCYYLQKPNDGF